LIEKSSKKERFLRFKGVVRKFRKFFERRYIWSGLLAGLLWTFSAPFVITAFLPSPQDLPAVVLWILFFPLELSNWLTWWIYDWGLVDPNAWTLIVVVVSVFVGMFLGVLFTYSIHRIRVWRRTHNISRTVPSE
jgi:ABC-type glycerol-3-phosphate transport system permease component